MTDDVAVTVVGGLGLAGALAVWKMFIYPIPGKVRERLTDIIQSVVRAETKTIRDELRPNGGGSLRDAIDRLLMEQTELIGRFRRHSQREWVMRGLDEPHRGVFATDANGKVQNISQQVQRWTGRSMDELRGDRWITIIAPAEREAVKRWWQATWSEGSYGEMDQCHIGADGRPIPVRIYCAPVWDDGKYIGHVGSITRMDIERCGRPREGM